MNYTTQHVNHFISLVVEGEIVAVLNEKARSVQVFNQPAFAALQGWERHAAGRGGWKIVTPNASNDARCMFDGVK